MDVPNEYRISFGNTIPNPKGGRVLKVNNFDANKAIWEKYYPDSTLTDFQLNEFFAKTYQPKFILEEYLKTRATVWRGFNQRNPKVNMKNFKGEALDGNYNIYYKDTPIVVFGEHTSNHLSNFSDEVKKALGI